VSGSPEPWRLQLLVPADRSLYPRVEAALAGGVTLVQLREKHRPDRETYEVGRELRDIVRRHGAAFFLDDRVDLALALGADGVHLGQADLPLDAARRLAPGLLIGVSCHDLLQVRAAQGADYIGFGPVFPTPSKDDADAPTGLSALREAVGASRRPVVAIGGVEVRSAADVRAAGAAGAAVIHAVLDAADAEEAARALLRALGAEES